MNSFRPKLRPLATNTNQELKIPNEYYRSDKKYKCKNLRSYFLYWLCLLYWLIHNMSMTVIEFDYLLPTNNVKAKDPVGSKNPKMKGECSPPQARCQVS